MYQAYLQWEPLEPSQLLVLWSVAPGAAQCSGPRGLSTQRSSSERVC